MKARYGIIKIQILIKSKEQLNSFLGKKCCYINTSDDTATLIQNLDPNKANGHDMLRIRYVKLCGKSVCKPLDLMFQFCMKHGEFPTKWKKANVVPVHKKVTNRFLRTIKLYLYFRFAEKSLNAFCIIDCMSISLRMN